ncbi:hypothetical protein FIBSPDRAFT_900536 [Athelia psychrophila]|uniref:Uncharacterized protein n=1 Tax=Athelia psychrophila TaxID=1759441 RepID=A0A165YDM5_9AGAM|nr:hypothetical protein FIBSPDRAFT_900536 [Fibularhizoctonia sp. CBS 109695]
MWAPRPRIEPAPTVSRGWRGNLNVVENGEVIKGALKFCLNSPEMATRKKSKIAFSRRSYEIAHNDPTGKLTTKEGWRSRRSEVMPKLQNNAVVGLDHPSSSILLIAKWFEPVHGLDRQFVIASVAFDSVALANEYVPAAGLRPGAQTGGVWGGSRRTQSKEEARCLSPESARIGDWYAGQIAMYWLHQKAFVSEGISPGDENAIASSAYMLGFEVRSGVAKIETNAYRRAALKRAILEQAVSANPPQIRKFK